MAPRKRSGCVIVADGYNIQENRGGEWEHFAAYLMDEPGAVSSCRWYNALLRGRRVFRVVLCSGAYLVVIHG